jgi:hypothetical protein
MVFPIEKLMILYRPQRFFFAWFVALILASPAFFTSEAELKAVES